MKNKIYTLLFIILTSSPTFAQGYYNDDSGMDIGTGFKEKVWVPSAFYYENMGIGRLNWLRGTIGIRSWAYYGKETVLKSQSDPTVANQLNYDKVSINGLSMVVGFNLKFGRLSVGANTDLIGASIGSKRSALYPEMGSESGNKLHNTKVISRPVIFNLAPAVLNNYNGQSEVYARIRITRSAGIKLGYLFGQTAYVVNKVNDKPIWLDGGKRRVSDHYSMPYVALSFAFQQ